MESNRSLYLTIGITVFLFTFVVFLIYLVYCYAYYDKNEEKIYTSIYNTHDFNYIYDNLSDTGDLDKDDFNIPIDLMYNKNNLKNIYYSYYKESSLFENLEDFINTYYYGEIIVNNDDIDFESYNKTTLISRRDIKYKSINLTNRNNYVTSIGLKKNVTLKLEKNAELVLDNKELSCEEDLCKIDNIFGGLHTIQYSSNNHNYYSIISIKEDNEIIDISTEDKLVTIKNTNYVPDTSNKEDKVQNADLNIGTYKINKCYIDGSCASKKKSYLTLSEDGTAKYYTYVSFEAAGDSYLGTYKIEGNFLILSFDSHIYSVYDYDTGQTTDIDAKVNTEIRYRIDNPTTLTNDSYQLKYSAE